MAENATASAKSWLKQILETEELSITNKEKNELLDEPDKEIRELRAELFQQRALIRFYSLRTKNAQRLEKKMGQKVISKRVENRLKEVSKGLDKVRK